MNLKQTKLKRIARKLFAGEQDTIGKVAEGLYELKDKVENYKAPLMKVELVGGTIKGVKGKDGIDGKNGKNGKDGAKGEKGDRGERGYEGRPGKDGRNGIDGIDGRDGKDGINGKDGNDGKDGEKGEPGEKGEKGDNGKDGKEVDVDKFKKEIYGFVGSRIGGGGNMNRNIAIGGNTSVLSMFTDINLKAGNNVSITYARNNTTKYTDVTISATGGGGSVGGTIRSINNINTSQTAGSTQGTDYVYLCTTGINVTLPSPIGNTNLYTIKNVSNSSVLVSGTIDNDVGGIIMPIKYTSVDLISNDTDWNIT